MYIRTLEKFYSYLNKPEELNNFTVYHDHQSKILPKGLINSSIVEFYQNQTNDEDLKIFTYLYFYKFVTSKQMARILNKSESKIREKLYKLLNENFINCFYLANQSLNTEDYKEALEFFCLDYQAKIVLERYSEISDVINWYYEDLLVSPLKILKYSIATELFSNLTDHNIKTNNSRQSLIIYSKLLKHEINFTFSINELENYIGYIIASNTEQLVISTNFKSTLQNLLIKKTYLRVFPEAKNNPSCIFIISNQEELEKIVKRLVALPQNYGKKLDDNKPEESFPLEKVRFIYLNDLLNIKNHEIKVLSGNKQNQSYKFHNSIFKF